MFEKDPIGAAAVFVIVAVLVAFGLAVGVVFVLPVAAIVVLGVLAWKWTSIQSAKAETARLQEARQTTVTATVFPSGDDFAANVLKPLLEERRKLDTFAAYPIFLTFLTVSREVYEAEELNAPPPEPEGNSELALARWRDELKRRTERASNPRLLEIADNSMRWAISRFIESLPPMALDRYGDLLQQINAEEALSGPKVPLRHALSDPREAVQSLVDPFFRDEAIKAGLFTSLRETLAKNAEAMSGKGDAIMPEKSTADPQEIIDGYLANTPFLRIFDAPIPFRIPERIRFEHTHVLAGSGHGKTTLLTQQLLTDLGKPETPALIIIDGKGAFYEELERLAVFAPGQPLSERVILLDPRDIEHPPALNMFVLRQHSEHMPPSVQLQLQEETINAFSYVFGAADFAMTEKQETCLSYAARILFKIPGSTLQTLLDLLADQPAHPKEGGIRPDSPFLPYIATLAPHHQDFIRGLFYHPTEYSETKRQLRNRIYSLLKHPSFAAMFLTKERKLDLFDVMQNRKILIVNASPAAIGETGAQLLGRYIISQALTSAYGRLAIPKSEWSPAYLIVDEAQMFVDEEKTQPLLQQAREFNLGVTLAHQKLDDLTPKLQATFAANTSIRYAGGVSPSDANFMAKNMRCDPSFLMAQEKTGTHTRFATYVRGYTARAVSLSVPLGILGAQPKMSADEHAALIERNRVLISAAPEPFAPPLEEFRTPEPPEEPPEEPDDDTPIGSPKGW